jgi:hypothetical protein
LGFVVASAACLFAVAGRAWWRRRQDGPVANALPEGG